MEIVKNLLMVVLILLSIALTVVVTMQTPKSEGFGGGVSNTPGGSFRGKAGYDEMLSDFTRRIAIGWFVTAFVLAIASEYARRHIS